MRLLREGGGALLCEGGSGAFALEGTPGVGVVAFVAYGTASDQHTARTAAFATSLVLAAASARDDGASSPVDPFAGYRVGGSTGGLIVRTNNR